MRAEARCGWPNAGIFCEIFALYTYLVSSWWVRVGDLMGSLLR
jgi:hypothetical protein